VGPLLAVIACSSAVPALSSLAPGAACGGLAPVRRIVRPHRV